jgi:hypothetical protein
MRIKRVGNRKQITGVVIGEQRGRAHIGGARDWRGDGFVRHRRDEARVVTWNAQDNVVA